MILETNILSDYICYSSFVLELGNKSKIGI